MKKLLFLLSCVALPLASAPSFACFEHMFAAGGMGMAVPERVFQLGHARMAKVPVGEESQIVIQYTIPPYSDNVKLHLSGIGKIELIDKEMDLPGSSGAVSVRFLMTVAGVSSIILTVMGEHEGEAVRESSAIYLLPQETPGSTGEIVSAR